MTPWQTATLCLVVFGAGYSVKGIAEAKRASDVAVAQTAQWQTYAAETVAAQRAESQRVIDAVAKLNPMREEQTQLVERITEEVRNAPATELCFSSPAIALALERLRGLTQTGAGDREQ